MLTYLRPLELITWNPLYEAWNFYRMDLIYILKRLGDEGCAEKPADGSWSPCEVADHLRVSQSLYANLLALVHGGKKGERRDDITVDYDFIEKNYAAPGKLKNPEVVNPSKEIIRQDLLKSLNKAMDKVEEYLNILFSA